MRTFEGEWQDWWAFGGAAMPREMEVARRAVYHTKAISSPVWGELNSGAKDELKEINRLLCRYFEHTYGSNETSEAPYSLYTQGQLNEKSSRRQMLVCMLLMRQMHLIQDGLNWMLPVLGR